MLHPEEREQRIGELTLRWEEARERGEKIPLSELTQGCPELALEVGRRIESFRAWDNLITPTDTGHGGTQTHGTSTSSADPGCPDLRLPLQSLAFHDRGGLGLIYRARQEDLPRDVAIKMLDPLVAHGLEDEGWHRFVREARDTARLEHPGIVPIYGLGRDHSGGPCYAMRFINGTTLKSRICAYHAARKTAAEARRRSLGRDPELRALLQRFRSACMTVAYAHSEGFLHRDLKPENIMLGPYDETLVVDWGLAKPFGPSAMFDAFPDQGEGGPGLDAIDDVVGHPDTRGGIGTVGFASPEQQAGDMERIGPSSDVFGLGATLYFLLTGHAPFAAKSLAERALHVETGRLQLPRSTDPRIPRQLEAICLKAMAHRPEARYASALALADDLEAWLADRPVSALRDSWTASCWRWVNAHRTLTTSTAVLLASASLLAGIVWRNLSIQAIQDHNLTYVSHEKAATELILRGRPGWPLLGLEHLAVAARQDTPLRDQLTLRGLAAQCLAGVDLRERSLLTDMNSACVAFRPDGLHLAVGEHHGEPDYRVQIFDLPGHRLLAQFVMPGENETKRTGVSELAYSPDGRWLAAGLRNGRILVWDTRRSQEDAIRLHSHSERIRCLAFTPDSTTLISGSQDGRLSIWDSGADWKLIASHLDKAPVCSLSLSPDGSLVALGYEHDIRVFSMSEIRKPAIEASPLWRHAVSNPKGLKADSGVMGRRAFGSARIEGLGRP